MNIQLQIALKLRQLDPTQAQLFLIKAQQLGAIALQKVLRCVHALPVDVRENPSLEPVKFCNEKADLHQKFLTPVLIDK